MEFILIMELVLLVGGKKFIEELKRIAKKSEELEVGFFPVSTYNNGLPVAQVAYWQEYGTYNIPVRAFFRTTFQNEKYNIGSEFAKQLKSSKFDIDLSFKYLGNYLKYKLQEAIQDWDNPANAPITIDGGWMKNKKSGKVFKVEGKGFNNPLVWSGKMTESVRWSYGDESA